MIHYWTKIEEDFLRTHYPKHGAASCAFCLNLPRKLVKGKISSLRLKLAPGIRITEDQKDFILKNIHSKSISEISLELGLSQGKIWGLCNRNGIKISTVKPFTPEDELYIRTHYAALSNKEIGQALVRSNDSIRNKAKHLGLKRTPEESRLIQEKYNLPSRFKKGQKSTNELADGVITTRSPHRGLSYSYIRISKNIWEPIQIYNWKKANGPIPEGKILRCKTKDTLNSDPDNWYITDRATHLVINSGREALEDRYIASILSMRDKEKRKQFAEMPELLEVKRNQLKLRRTIDEFSKN